MEKERRKGFWAGFRFAGQGIAAGLRNERNMKIHLAAVILVSAAGFGFHISKTEWLVCLVLFGQVMGAELLNTAIEAAVDLACKDEHPLAKLAKDAAAGGVLVCAIFAAIAGVIIFLPKVWALFL